MRAVGDDIETIHLYVVRDREKRPYTLLPLLGVLLCLLGIVAVTLYSAVYPSYEHERLTVPAQFLPLKVFTAEVPIIPTRVKTYPATYATGRLTLTNGSVLSEVLPAGIIFTGANGAEVQTTEPVAIPAGSAVGYGVASVAARALQAGGSGNIPTLAVNVVYGTALYIRNLTAFTGGTDGYAVPVVTAHDIQTALHAARSQLAPQKKRVNAVLASPCGEALNSQQVMLQLTVTCQFAVYHVPSYVHVTTARLVGRTFVVDALLLPHPCASEGSTCMHVVK